MTGLASSAKHPMTRRAWLGRASLASLGAGMSGWLALAIAALTLDIPSGS